MGKRKPRHLVWCEGVNFNGICGGGYDESDVPECAHETSTLYSEDTGGWENIILFEKGGQWHLHFGNMDPSEHIYSGPKREDVVEYANEHHRKGLIGMVEEENYGEE